MSLRDTGIVRNQHWLLYGWKYGFGRGWLSHRVQRRIVGVWNALSCRLLGHDDKGFGKCQACLKPFPKDPVLWAAIEASMEKHRSRHRAQ